MLASLSIILKCCFATSDKQPYNDTSPPLSQDYLVCNMFMFNSNPLHLNVFILLLKSHNIIQTDQHIPAWTRATLWWMIITQWSCMILAFLEYPKWCFLALLGTQKWYFNKKKYSETIFGILTIFKDFGRFG